MVGRANSIRCYRAALILTGLEIQMVVSISFCCSRVGQGRLGMALLVSQIYIITYMIVTQFSFLDNKDVFAHF